MEQNKIEHKITQTIYRSYKVEIERKITNVIHDLPTWMFPEEFCGALKTPCPICNQEMRKQIGHGMFIETCSMIELDERNTMPIHTECYNKITNNERT